MSLPPQPPSPFDNPGAGFPPQGAPATVPFASWGQRVGATLVDALVLIVLFIVLGIIGAILSAVSDVLGGLWLLLSYLVYIGLSFYYAYLTGSKGQSPGKKVMGIQVVNANTGQFIGGGMGIVRNLAHTIDAIPCYIGFLLPLFDSKKQTIADKLLTTVVIAGPKQSLVQAFMSSLPGK
jgi:uncharacterized RDD family membrane protein YckC